jgi:hypothetical protein
MIQMFFKPAYHWPASRALIGRYGPWLGEPGPDWAIRALIGRYAEGVPAYVTAIHLINSVVYTYTRWTWQSEIWVMSKNSSSPACFITIRVLYGTHIDKFILSY